MNQHFGVEHDNLSAWWGKLRLYKTKTIHFDPENISIGLHIQDLR